jgi:hypothetical protein
MQRAVGLFAPPDCGELSGFGVTAHHRLRQARGSCKRVARARVRGCKAKLSSSSARVKARTAPRRMFAAYK